MRVADDSSDTVFEQLIRREAVEKTADSRLILTVLGPAYGDRCGRAFIAGTKKLISLAPNMVKRADRR